jgi:hypothetical protein
MSWWKHFESELPRLAELGFTQVWLPPLSKAMAGKKSTGYDAYDLWDIGEFDQRGTIPTRWGTREELLEACSVARQNNIGVIIDAVLNVILPGFFVEPALTLKYTSINLELIGQKHFPPCAWIQRTGCVLWNRSVKLEYVDTQPCKYFALALVGLDSVRLPRTTRKV